MSERLTRRRLPAAATVIAALFVAAGVPASASRGAGGTPDGAAARAVAARVVSASFVTAEAEGDATDDASGPAITVPGILDVRTAESAAETAVRGRLRARAGSRLGGVTVQGDGATIERTTREAVAVARGRVHDVLLAACGAGAPVEANVVADVVVAAVVEAGTTAPFGTLEVDASIKAELRAGIAAALDGGAATGPLCAVAAGRRAERIAGAVESTLRTVLTAHLSLSMTVVHTECDLARHAASARTRLLVTRHTAAVLGLDGSVDGDAVHVEVRPGTRVEVGSLSVTIGEEHRTYQRHRRAEVEAHGVVVRAGETVIASLASVRCEVRGDVVIDRDAPSGGPSPGVSVPAGDTGAGAGTGTSVTTRRDEQRLGYLSADASMSLAGRL